MTLQMTPEQWQRAKDVFAAASDLEAAARAEYVASIAYDDKLVQSEVLSLLAAPEMDALERPAVEWARDWWNEQEGVDPWLGERIGAYRINALIGSGGMGDV
jgi:eukaryotic-like serine/threonine-protein kinase